jgi:hypothetical protein
MVHKIARIVITTIISTRVKADFKPLLTSPCKGEEQVLSSLIKVDVWRFWLSTPPL